MKICAVIIETTDNERLASWYRKALEWNEPSHVLPDHLGFTLENTYIGFDRVDERQDAARPATTTWFAVDDARAWHDRLIALGATHDMRPDDTCSSGEFLAIVRDPDGNRIGLLSPA